MLADDLRRPVGGFEVATTWTAWSVRGTGHLLRFVKLHPLHTRRPSAVAPIVPASNRDGT